MDKKYKIALLFLLPLGVVALVLGLAHGHTMAVLSPQGTIAHQERTLIIAALLLSLIVVVPVFIMLFGFAWKYRATNTKAHYKPDVDGNRKLETIWWLVPLALIMVLSVMAWRSSHTLDPFKPIVSNAQPLNVQVVALDWKWLFIYPDQHIASVNELRIPTNRPINFSITADAPMNSFWIPRLGGQVYAMAGMQTQLHLMADHNGTYKGSSANISGRGFAGMRFNAIATSQKDFDAWAMSATNSPNRLSQDAYNTLGLPSENNAVATYSSASEELFDSIIMKYMMPSSGERDPTNCTPGLLC